MSDLSIPGVKSNIDTDKIIQALLEPEKVKIENKKNEIENLNDKKSIWQDLSVRLTRLQDSSKGLFNQDNPFDDRVALSDDDKILTATVDRETAEGTKEFIIKQQAKADRFKTDSLNLDYEAAPGTYRFTIGEEEIEFDFNGGSLKELADKINSKAKDLLKASIVNDTVNTQVMIIESQITGAGNKLTFEQSALSWALDTGVLEKTAATDTSINFEPNLLATWGKPQQPDLVKITDGRLVLGPQSQYKIPIAPGIQPGPNMVLKIDFEVKIITEEGYNRPETPPGPQYSAPEGTSLGDINIQNEWPDMALPKAEVPPPPQRKDDLSVFAIGNKGAQIPLPLIGPQAGPQTLTIKAADLSAYIDALYVQNNNTHRQISISQIRLYDPSARGEYTPKNALSEASDSILYMDGIEVTRDSNEIDDLIPGVKLNILGQKEGPTGLNITKDMDSIVQEVLKFVGFYNQLLTQIDILSRNDSAVLDDAAYLTDAELEKARDNLGLLQGDVTLSQLKSRLRTILSDAYPTAGDSELALMAQLGIATHVTELGTGGIDKTKLRGYLEMDEEQFSQAVQRHPEWVKQLFGWDSDGDFITDSGLAFKLVEYIKPYIQVGGIIPTKVTTIDTSIAGKNSDIDDLNQHLADYEERLKKEYGMMEGMLQQLEQNRKSLENFNGTGQK